METNLALLDLLERILGKGEKRSKGNYAFFCPNCKHYKKKLEINLNCTKWSCWICGSKDNFKGQTIKSLFKRLNISQEYFQELHYLIPQEKILRPEDTVFPTNVGTLPNEFVPLYGIEAKGKLQKLMLSHATGFLKSRGIREIDCLKYNIGVCFWGDHENRIIIPSYDHYGRLNYYVSRDFTDTQTPRYKNPMVPVGNIIGFEIYVNWDAPVIICEGIFDAISIQRNVIPLFGKVIYEKLMKRLVENKVKKIYLALDRDAIEDSLKYCEVLMKYGKEIYLVELTDKDPNEMGRDKFFDLVETVEPLTFQTLVNKKLELI